MISFIYARKETKHSAFPVPYPSVFLGSIKKGETIEAMKYKWNIFLQLKCFLGIMQVYHLYLFLWNSTSLVLPYTVELQWLEH